MQCPYCNYKESKVVDQDIQIVILLEEEESVNLVKKDTQLTKLLKRHLLW